jgi:phosphatidylglycerol:prolipoprotein diacylglycerol transferase
MELRPLLPYAALWGAFWTALITFPGRSQSSEALRLVLALLVGAALAHLGWMVLYLPHLLDHPLWILDPTRGFSVLFLPLGPVLLAPRGVPRRRAFLTRTFASLPLPLAVARLGCLAAGCCYGIPTSTPWGVQVAAEASVHPTPLYEIAGCLGLHGVLRRVPSRCVTPVFLAGFGLIRLLVEPWRSMAPIGPPVVPPALLAAAWLVAGLQLARTRLALRHAPCFERSA